MSSTKTDKELQDALNEFRAMDRETTHEAAHTYLLSVTEFIFRRRDTKEMDSKLRKQN